MKIILFGCLTIFIFHRIYAQNQTEWSSNNYPNPFSEYFACNAVFNNQGPNRVCDPNSIFQGYDRAELNDILNGLEAKTGQTNTTNCAQKGVTAAVILAGKINGGTAMDASNMAITLLNKWTFDSCRKGILILLSRDDKKFWAAKGQSVPVEGSVFTEIFNNQKNLFTQGQYYQGLLNVVEDIGNRIQIS